MQIDMTLMNKYHLLLAAYFIQVKCFAIAELTWSRETHV